jgi:hypothetical protein
VATSISRWSRSMAALLVGRPPRDFGTSRFAGLALVAVNAMPNDSCAVMMTAIAL